MSALWLYGLLTQDHALEIAADRGLSISGQIFQQETLGLLGGQGFGK